MASALRTQYAKVSDDNHMKRISEIMSQMSEYSVIFVVILLP